MRARSTRIVVLLWVLVFVAAPTFSQDTAPNKELPNFQRVNEALFRGGQPKAGGYEMLSQMGIKTVVNLRDDDSRAKEEEFEVKQAGLKYFNVPLRRLGPPKDEKIEALLSIITNPANQPVFVHCAHGADRTGVVIAAYRISRDGWTFDQAKAEAKRYGLKPWQLRMKRYIREYYKRQIRNSEAASN